MSEITIVTLPGADCRSPLTVRVNANRFLVRIVASLDDGAEVGNIALKWVNGALHLDGWSHTNIVDDADVPDVAQTLYSAD